MKCSLNKCDGSGQYVVELGEDRGSQICYCPCIGDLQICPSTRHKLLVYRDSICPLCVALATIDRKEAELKTWRGQEKSLAQRMSPVKET